MKKSMALSEVKLVNTISKNLKSFLKISPMQKKVLHSHKMEDHANQYNRIFSD